MEGLNQWNFNIFVKNIVWNIVSLIPMFYLMFWPKTSANARSGPGFHVCGLNKIIPDWKRNSQSGCPVESELQWTSFKDCLAEW